MIRAFLSKRGQTLWPEIISSTMEKPSVLKERKYEIRDRVANRKKHRVRSLESWCLIASPLRASVSYSKSEIIPVLSTSGLLWEERNDIWKKLK